MDTFNIGEYKTVCQILFVYQICALHFFFESDITFVCVCVFASERYCNLINYFFFQKQFFVLFYL